MFMLARIVEISERRNGDVRHQYGTNIYYNNNIICLQIPVSIFIFDYRFSHKREPIQIAASINGSCKTNICGRYCRNML